MAGAIADLVARWMERLGIDPAVGPDRYALEMGFPESLEPCRPGASPRGVSFARPATAGKGRGGPHASPG